MGSRPDDLLARRGGAVELLRLPALLMRALSGARNRLYDHGWLPSRRLSLPIVSVGNLTVGGTGKTPMVAFLAKALAERGFRPGVVSRGYKAEEHTPETSEESVRLNDEGQLLARSVPGLLQVQDPDRALGAIQLEQQGADVVILDDGFQHRRLARDLDLVLVDATRPWGLPATEPGGAAVRSHLPRGLLREGLDSLARASAVVLTRCDAVSTDRLAELEAELEAAAPGVPRLLAAHRPSDLRRSEERLGVETLRGREVVLVSGIGNPQAFEVTARELGARVVEVRAFPDHHAFEAGDLAALPMGAEALVTAKDAVKLERLGVTCLVLEVELELVRGAPVLDALLDALPLSQRALEREAIHSGLHG